MKWRLWLYLFLIVVVTAFLRLFKLPTVPPSLYWDEVAIGWNAKTIFHTRRDEYGTRLPTTFKSFGDYKAPAYIYLTAPFVGFFGMHEWTVRLVSVLAGIGSVVVIFFVCKSLFPARYFSLPAIGALMLSVTPWHVMMSRPAFEANLALFFISVGVWVFLLALQKRPYLMIAALLSFVLAMYSYHSPKVFVPVLIVGLLFIYKNELFSRRTLLWTIISGVIAILALIPLVKSMFAGGSTRFIGTSIFYSQSGVKLPVDLLMVGTFLQHYIVHFSPEFLFRGMASDLRAHMNEVGVLLWAQAPLLVIGILVLLFKFKEKWSRLLLWWLLAAPVAAAIGREIPHAIRAYQLVIPLAVISALGSYQLYFWLQRTTKYLLWSAMLVVTIGFSINVGYFLTLYFLHYPVYAASSWQYGYKEAAAIARVYEDKVDKIVITSHYGQPHIFMNFYQHRQPLEVFWGGMIKYLYKDIHWDLDKERQNTLFIATPEEISPTDKKVIDKIMYPNGIPAFVIAKT